MKEKKGALKLADGESDQRVVEKERLRIGKERGRKRVTDSK